MKVHCPRPDQMNKLGMVEVFRTNVSDRHQANWLIDQIQSTFQEYKATFDLEDCDRILVVRCATENVKTSLVIDLLEDYDFIAEVLPDV
jgi:hypothetical protein